MTVIDAIKICSASALVAACSAGEPPAGEPRLVVEGYFDSGGYPEVLLNMSMVPSEEGGNISESIVRWAVVTVSDGEKEVILTGGPSDKYFPPYHYYSYDMRGEAGKYYTLKATYQGNEIVSTGFMYPATPIEEIAVSPVEGVDTLRHLSVKFTSPDDVPAYYHLSAQIHTSEGRMYPCMVATHAVTEAGVPVTLPVYRANRTTSTSEYSADFPVGEIVSVRLARIDRAAYEFWHAFDNAALVAGSVFVGGPGSLPGNIAGGYGVWSVQGASMRPVRVE